MDYLGLITTATVLEWQFEFMDAIHHFGEKLLNEILDYINRIFTKWLPQTDHAGAV
jgi:hypothetical protein